MIFSNNFSFVLRDSKDHFHKFFLSEDNSLMLEPVTTISSEGTYTIEQDILDYSVDIDREDKIHILFLNGAGELCYRLHPLLNTQKKLVEINLKTTSMKFLTLKVIDEDIHIFYMLSNRHSSTWSIYHSLWHNNAWTVKKVVEVTAEKLLQPYRIDYTKNNLYLFYSKNSRDSYGIKKFNLDFYMWGDLDECIDLNGSHNASFIINERNVAFICYSSSIYRNIYTVIKYRDLNNNSSRWSKDLPLSENSINALHPCMIIRNNYTYVLWEEGDALVFRKTDSGQINWTNKNILLTQKSSVSNCVYISSHPSEPGFKSTFCPLVLATPPYPIINLEKSPERQQFIESEKQLKSQTANISNLTNMISKEEYIRELQLILIEKDKKLLETVKLKEILTRELETIKSVLSTKDMEIAYLQQQLSDTQEEYAAYQKEQEEKYNKLLEELNNNSAREAAAGLTDRESTIERLNILVNSLYQENTQKDLRIEELEQKLNKGLFRRIFG
ncbi:hypothetical protein [Clostridium thermarum]|uniref:hypothetical protein n=1 Tax=Clostridium thermarum TaxID=1716543 RepID=UPI001124A52D|nr:hypothetical protein [Clostridium thermarum]